MISIKTSLLLLLLLVSASLPAQQLRHKNSPSALDKELKGKVKTWTMKNDTGIVRQQKFDENGKLVHDSYKGSASTYIYPEILGHHISKQAEKIYPSSEKIDNGDSLVRFNNRKQVIEKKVYLSSAFKNKNTWGDASGEKALVGSIDKGTGKKLLAYHVKNKFNGNGKVVYSQQFECETSTYYYQDPRTRPSPGMDSTRSVALFTYNAAGNLEEFQYYHSDIFKCIRMVYTYENNNLVQSLRYDDSDINRDHFSDDFLYKILKATEGPSFDINKYFPGFWNTGSPSKETWKYAANNMIEYIAYGYMGGPSFRATWEYDEKGQLLKEVHHDVYHNTIRAEIWFDEQGNVIRETDHDYWAKTKYSWRYEIEYY